MANDTDAGRRPGSVRAQLLAYQPLPAKNHPLSATGALSAYSGWVAIAFLAAIRLDAPVIRLVHASTTPALDHAFDVVSDLADARFSVIAGLGLFGIGHVLRSCKRMFSTQALLGAHMVRSGLLMLFTLLSGGVIVALLKQAAARARPTELIEHGFNGFGLPFSGYPFNSFPSSHALTAFALAAVAGHIHPYLRVPMWFFAVMVATCRVLTLEHYPSDVMFSAVIAYGCANFWAHRVMNPRADWPLQRRWRPTDAERKAW